MFIGQQNRLLKLTNSLGPDILLPQRVHALEHMYTMNKAGDFIPLSDNYVDALLKLEGTSP